jgi:outer membrane protein TolC
MPLFRPSFPWTLSALLVAGCLAPCAPAAGPPVTETVHSLVAEALEKSPALAAARAESSAARERIAPAGALPDPMLSLS